MFKTEKVHQTRRINLLSGNDRIVFVGRNHVAKIPRVSPIKFSKEATGALQYGGLKYAIDYLRHYKPDQMGLQRWILRGRYENMREHRLAATYPEVIAPTRTVLGLCNIQPKLSPLALNANAIWSTFVQELGGQTPVLGHMMEDATNFGKDNQGNVLFVDGGSRGLDRLLPEKQVAITKALARVALLDAEIENNELKKPPCSSPDHASD